MLCLSQAFKPNSVKTRNQQANFSCLLQIMAYIITESTMGIDIEVEVGQGIDLAKDTDFT